MIPFPGTPDASRYSHIIFSSLQPRDLRSVAVTGSTSGSDPGRVVALPDGAGSTFLPDHPFAPGERVQVSATLSSPAAGTASGDPGATALSFSFTVAIRPSPRPPGTAPTAQSAQESPGVLSSTSPAPSQSFRSAPDLHPPVVSATADSDPRSGDVLLTPWHSQQEGPMILDSRGRLLWFRPINGFAANLEVQRYRDQPVLTWFQQTAGNRATNEDVIMNRSYEIVGTVHGIEDYVPDMHEFQLTSSGTAWLDSYTLSQADLSGAGGPSNGVVMDCLVQERDVRTGQLLWEWHALGHIPLRASYVGAPSSAVPYDFFHLNSIQQLPNGNVLISARNTWSVYEIDRQTGRVIWTLGGRYSSFRVPRPARFEWQHDARLQAGGTLSVFDDAADPRTSEETQSSAKTIRLDMATKSASLVRRFTHRPPLTSEGEGSAQVLADHNVFVGWGQQPAFTEYTAAGKQIFNGTLPLGTTSYRAYRFPWSGSPLTRPSVAVSRQPSGGITVYVSWNGATGVAAWGIRGGPRPSDLHSIGRSRRTGFETVIPLSRRPRYLAVQALDAQGSVLAVSAVQRV